MSYYFQLNFDNYSSVIAQTMTLFLSLFKNSAKNKRDIIAWFERQIATLRDDDRTNTANVSVNFTMYL